MVKDAGNGGTATRHRRAVTIRTRLITLAVINLLALLSIGVGIARTARRLSFDWATLQSVSRRQTLLSQMKSALGYGGAIHHFKNYVIRRDERYVERGKESFRHFQESAERYRDLEGVTEEELNELIVIEETMQRYVEAFTTAREMFSAGATVAEVDSVVMIDDRPALKAYTTLDDQLRESAKARNTYFVERTTSSIFFLLGVAIVALLLVLTLSTVTERFITHRLGRILAVTGVVARGDLTHAVGMNTRDEIGILAANFDSAITNLRDLIGEVKVSSDANLHSSATLREQTESSSEMVRQIADNITTISEQFATLDGNIATSSAATEEIFAHISSLVTSISKQSDAVRTTSAAVEEMTSSIESVSKISQAKRVMAQELVSLTRLGGEKLTTAGERIDEIGHSVEGVMEILSVINNVAAKTNLLSMNAAIEAAHAGDAGRGFAVVANEIKKLAESTSRNANTISASLSRITAAVDQAKEISVESSEAFGHISDGVRDVVAAFQEISGTNEELTVGSREILHSAVGLMRITEHINAGAGEMKSGAQEIRNALLQVKVVSSQTLEELTEIDATSREITRSLEHIVTISRSNKESATTLQADVAEFVTE